MNNYKNSKGFGIIEVLITAVLLIIVTGSVIGLSRTIVRNNIVSIERTEAYNLLRSNIEQIIATRNDNWKNGLAWDTGIEATDSNGLQKDPIALDNVSYTITTIIEDIGNELAENMEVETSEYLQNQAKRITVKVSWEDANKTYDITDEIVLTNWKPQL